jgi:hypothetical protein
MRAILKTVFLLLCAVAPAPAQPATYVPDLWPTPSKSASELRDAAELLRSDWFALQRRWSVEESAARNAQFRAFFEGWKAKLPQIRFESLSQDGKADYVMLRNRLDYELKLLDRAATVQQEAAPLMPYAATIASLHDARRRMEPVDARAAATALAKMVDDIARAQRSLETGAMKPSKIIALRVVTMSEDLKRVFEQWFRFYNLYDPMFSWWADDPYKRAAKAMDGYLKFLRERVVGYKEGEDEPIVGDPIGRQALLDDLAYEMIPYSPEELVDIANKEYAWCEAEM